MSFEKVGTPQPITQVVSFNEANKVDKLCKCGNKIGEESSGILRLACAGQKMIILAGKITIKCEKCGEEIEI